MHRSIATRTLILPLALILSIQCLGAEGGEARAVTIRIHDYAHIQDAALARAQEVVTGMYDAIGVRTDWRKSLEQSDGVVGGFGARDGEPSDLMIIILTSAMASRDMIPGSIVGFAAVGDGVGRSRIAYVVYDRLRDLARGTTVDDMRMMGIVMAHEIGHLLLLRQSHSDGGLMRERWLRSELRSTRPADLRFSETQAVEIRRTIGGGVGRREADSETRHGDSASALTRSGTFKSETNVGF